ncbi:MAG: hypothetical protein KBF68_00970 [Nitrosomonas sp.]|jgi:hypothetical protein|nr:hypothetical protein [Nitrosomonas sp.]MBP9099954.1 hypothetical protein [Nitrosomonas sp.]
MSFEMGRQVRLVQPVIQGEIIDTEYDKSRKELKHLIEWQDADGAQQQRWFLESELEAVE